jgi:hypothetical protein
MIEPPKLSPLSGANDADCLASLGKARGEHTTGCQTANPIPSLFRPRMLAIGQLKALRIKKRFDCLGKTHSVLSDVFIVFCKVPFEFHRLDHTTSIISAPST